MLVTKIENLYTNASNEKYIAQANGKTYSVKQIGDAQVNGSYEYYWRAIEPAQDVNGWELLEQYDDVSDYIIC